MQMLLSTARASSEGLERIFSTFGLVHSKVRKKLGVKMTAKVVFLFKALNANSTDI